MQQSAVPELAHTTTRPIHWVATAAALAAVVAGSSFLQPDDATAAQPARPGKSSVGTQSAPAPAPDPAGVSFPLDCGTVGAKVHHRAAGDLDGDGRPETVVAVRCDAGSGNPPDGVYVLTRSADTGAPPRVVATLVDPKDRRNAGELTIRHGAVLATLRGYSSPDVPSCCPDVTERASWRWHDGTFQRTDPDRADSV
ncbi:hypothetical protein HUT18_03820 [Streptomyces sp. NA04227]|uniref:hypothetical protein n=1 Tax=Streptomyces sp. NA04227 TaxID=2742136 RepID=UPI001591758D|nr:hypothetical protein [Streptomyces sp. NA04227]QKW05633.1 hypothetical protein HUT18_03820 [Streptomyces sp. NA04227]